MTQIAPTTVRLHLADTAIQALTSPTAGRVSYRDTRLPQLLLLIGPRSRSFYVHATMHRRTHRVALGRWPIVGAEEARTRCLDALRRLYRGESPTTTKPKIAPTLGAVLDEYVGARTLAPASVRDLRGVVGLHCAQWVGRPIDAIDARALAARYRAVAAGSVSVAARLLRHVSALTRYAAAAHGVGDTDLLKRARALLGEVEAVAPRDVLIDDGRQFAWSQAIDAEPVRVGRYLRALALTGCRANELRRLPAAGWDSDSGVVHIATTKNGKAHALAVGPMLRAIFDAEAESMQSQGAAALLFDVPESQYRRALDRVGATIGLAFSRHDLRRGFATIATRAGVDASMVKRLMNHATAGDVTARHYVKLNAEDMRPAMRTVEERLQALWQGVEC